MMNVAYAFNQVYLEAAMINIFSLLRARRDDRPVTLYLLVDAELKEEQLSPAFQMAEHFGSCRVVVMYPQREFPRIFCSDEAGCLWPEGVQTAFYRLFLSKLLPDQERCLYLDIDLVVRKDLSPLYDTDLDGVCFAGVTDRLCLEEDQRIQMRRLGIRDGWYINSGVLLMNLSRLRRTGLDGRLLAHAGKTACPYLDQDVINTICPGEIRLLPKRYNVFSMDLPGHYDVLRGVIPDEMLEENDFTDPSVVHFIGPDKPWGAAPDSVPDNLRDKEWRALPERKQYWTVAEMACRDWIFTKPPATCETVHKGQRSGHVTEHIPF